MRHSCSLYVNGMKAFITIFPTLSNSSSIGKEPPAPPMSPLTSFVNDGHGGVHHSIHHESSITGTRSGQILWIRGLTRLQTQVGRGPPADDRLTSIDRDRPTLNQRGLALSLSVSLFLST